MTEIPEKDTEEIDNTMTEIPEKDTEEIDNTMTEIPEKEKEKENYNEIHEEAYKYEKNKKIPINMAQNYIYKTYYTEKNVNPREKQQVAPFKIIKKKNIPMYIHINHSILDNIYKNPKIKKDIYLDGGLADADEEDNVSANHLPLDYFDDPEYELFSPQEWLEMKKIYWRDFDINQEPRIKDNLMKLIKFNSEFYLRLQHLSPNNNEEYIQKLNQFLNNEKVQVEEEYLGYDEDLVKFFEDLKKKEKDYFDQKRKDYFKTKEYEIEPDPEDTSQEIKELLW